MIVRTDLALLRQRIRVPEAVTSATWTVLPVGGAGDTVPGPTDTRLWAYLRADGGGFGAGGAPGAVLVPEAVAAAILPPELLAGAEREGDARRVEGASFDPAALDRGAYRGVRAVQAGGGLLAVLQTQ
jgi:hypothetical protein